MRQFILSLCLGFWALTTVADAAIVASGSPNNSTTITQYNGNQGGGFTISEDVAYDPSAGQWVKQLINAGGMGIGSGVRVGISETFTNTGLDSWTDWHEEIISITDLGGGGPQPGFLFDEGSLSVLVDDGGGFQPLTEGVDYTVVAGEFMGPGAAGDNMGWQAISIYFEPNAVIQPGDVLRINKQIFEVFLDANIWQTGEAAEISQYPTVPEPESWVLAAYGGAVLAIGLLQRRKHRSPFR